MNTTRCAGTTRAGKPCRSFTYRPGPDGAGLCRVHFIEAGGKPDELAQLRADRARGGRASANLIRARKELAAADQMTVADALKLLSAATVRVYAGDLPPNVGTALAGMVGTLVKVHETENVEAALIDLERYTRIT